MPDTQARVGGAAHSGEWGLEQPGRARLWNWRGWGPQVDLGDVVCLAALLWEP